ncbi:two component system sensor histidine kinase [Desulfosarcina variabilis str. Montpellier]|uniref:HDOD domain-containing protein n=1 Tax=Desulfosarcina variabilis TaxID=2300 RepID=UPI003AFB151F
MPFVSTDRIKPGMVLAADVLDSNGRLLLAEGKAITASHVNIFKMWGVPEVSVTHGDDATAETDKPLDPGLMRQVAEKLKNFFAENDFTHPAVAEIFRQAILHRSRRTDHFDETTAIGRDGVRQPIRSTGTELRKKISQRDIKLPEIPSIIFKLNDTIADPFSSADDIAQVISKSPGLSALLLRIVNSAFYGFPSRIDSVARAVTIIGSKEVTALAVGISTMEVFKDIPKTVFDMRAFTQHSLACGVLSRILAASGNIRNTEQMFVSGLLHDIGRLVIFKYYPQAAVLMLSAQSGDAVSLIDSEKKTLGFRHTDIAADLFEKWKFPVTLIQNVVFHHRPAAAQDPVKAGMIHLADMIAHSLGEGKSGEWRLPTLDTDVWDKLRISPQALSKIIPQAIHHLDFLSTIFQTGG